MRGGGQDVGTTGRRTGRPPAPDDRPRKNVVLKWAAVGVVRGRLLPVAKRLCPTTRCMKGPRRSHLDGHVQKRGRNRAGGRPSPKMRLKGGGTAAVPRRSRRPSSPLHALKRSLSGAHSSYTQVYVRRARVGPLRDRIRPETQAERRRGRGWRPLRRKGLVKLLSDADEGHPASWIGVRPRGSRPVPPLSALPGEGASFQELPAAPSGRPAVSPRRSGHRGCRCRPALRSRRGSRTRRRRCGRPGGQTGGSAGRPCPGR